MPDFRRVFRLPWRSRAQIHGEVEEEIRFHLDMRADELMREGLPAAEARARARREFGDMDDARLALLRADERSERDRRRTEWADALLRDLRFATRGLRRNRVFSTVAVLTLALGIGANSAIFSVVDGVLLRPLPYADEDRLVHVWPEGSFPAGGFLPFRDEARSFAAVAGYAGGAELTLVDGAEPTRLEGVRATSNLFEVLGVGAALGRTFLPQEEQPGQGDVVLLSHALWRQRFGGDPAVLGRRLELDGAPHTVVGVMPADFRFPSRSAQLWVPATFDAADPVGLWSGGWLRPVARLRPGASLAQAQAEVDAFMPRLRAMFPWRMPDDWGRGATVVPLRDEVVGDVRPTLLLLLGAVGVVLLIACANVANLLLVRANVRQREIAIRSALGAGRGRLVRQLLTESLVLSLAGGTLGMAIAAGGVELLTATLPADTPRLDEIGIDARVLAFTLALTLLTGVLFGSLPALRLSGGGAGVGPIEGGRGVAGTRSRRRLASALVAGEIALAVVVVIGAGLLVRSFGKLLQVDPGFRTENVVTALVAPSEAGFPDDASRREFFTVLEQRLRALPGVAAAAATSQLPFSPGVYVSAFMIDGRPDPATDGGDWPLADAAPVVGGEYLRAMGIPLLRGRGFDDSDREDAPGVVLVSESLARRYWPTEEAVGQRIRFPGPTEQWRTVVGVVGDVKWERLAEEQKATMYTPLRQGRTGPMRVVLRTTGDAQALASSLRAVVASLDARTPVSDVRSAEQRIAASVEQPRFAMILFAGFALLALVLGAVGVYGLIAYTVHQRTREIGIRMALGAGTGDVLRLVLLQGAGLALAGVALGLVLAFAATRAMRSLLFGVGAADPVVFTLVPLLLVAVAALASLLPARRAARVAPVEALRAE